MACYAADSKFCSVGAQDDKIIAVHYDDPEFRGYEDISQLPKHRLMEIRRQAPLPVLTSSESALNCMQYVCV